MLKFEFNESQTKRIKFLANKLNMSISHIIRLAMSLLSVANRELKKGNNIVITKDNKVIKNIKGIAR